MARGQIVVCGILALQAVLAASMVTEERRVDALPANKEKLTVFYESYCPFSIKFILQQLYPVTIRYSRYIALDLIPFGNCMVHQENNGTWDFKCQHGEKECYGNSVHACVIDQGKSKGDPATIEVIACLMTFNYSDQEIQKCLQKSKFSMKRHKLCMTRDATSLEVAYGKRTAENAPKVNYVPFLMFNDVYYKNVEALATRDLEFVICQLFVKQKPATCTNDTIITELEKFADN